MGYYKDFNLKRNLAMLTDFYEFTMSNGYFENGMKDKIVYFDVFFRRVPDNGGFAIMAGLDTAIKYIQDLEFTEDDINYLRKSGSFSEEFLNYLKNMQFECDIWSVPEGTVMFAGEPIMTVRGPIIQTQLIETMLLICINHQSLIATKANRIVRAAKGRKIMEFGARRAQGFDGAVYGSRAAYIAGCSSTSCTLSEQEFSIPAMGTMAHSWVQMFDSELEAFRTYARTYPESCMLLVDTYNVLKSGIPNAIKIFREEIVPRGYRPLGIRIDSGDITYISKQARVMLDEAGFEDCKICASNALDEYIIHDMIIQGAKVDMFGVGERLITSSSEPIFGGVYKLVAVEEDNKIVPKIKISENVAKITNPGVKELWRLYDRNTNKAIADVITSKDETIDDNNPYVIFDPKNIWKRKTLNNFKAVKIRQKVFDKGKLCCSLPNIDEIREYCKNQVDTLWEEVTRFENPHEYYVDLSLKLWRQKQKMISENI